MKRLIINLLVAAALVVGVAQADDGKKRPEVVRPVTEQLAPDVSFWDQVVSVEPILCEHFILEETGENIGHNCLLLVTFKNGNHTLLRSIEMPDDLFTELACGVCKLKKCPPPGACPDPEKKRPVPPNQLKQLPDEFYNDPRWKDPDNTCPGKPGSRECPAA
jgi:hypothetical protein